MFFPGGRLVDLNAEGGTAVTLILAGGTTATTITAASGGIITIPAGGLNVTQISYQVGSRNAVVLTASNVTFDTTTNAGKINDLVVQAGPLALANSATIAVDGNINLVTSRFVNNAGSSALTDGDGVATTKNWRVWSTNADPFNVSTGNTVGGLVYGFKQYNAPYGTTTVLGTGNGLLHTLAPTLTVSLTGTVSKTYNGTTAATLTDRNYAAISGVVDGDAVTFSKPGSGTYATKDAGAGSATTTADRSTPAGRALISAGVGNLAATNYTFVLVNGVLTMVAPAPVQEPAPVPQLAPVSAALTLSSSVGGEANGYLEDTVVIGNQSTGENTGGLGLRLHILDGGVTLQPDSVNVNEKDKS